MVLVFDSVLWFCASDSTLTWFSRGVLINLNCYTDAVDTIETLLRHCWNLPLKELFVRHVNVSPSILVAHLVELRVVGGDAGSTGDIICSAQRDALR